MDQSHDHGRIGLIMPNNLKKIRVGTAECVSVCVCMCACVPECVCNVCACMWMSIIIEWMPFM